MMERRRDWKTATHFQFLVIGAGVIFANEWSGGGIMAAGSMAPGPSWGFSISQAKDVNKKVEEKSCEQTEH